MDALQGETEDSRTSAVGRKRGLAEFEPPQEPLSDHSDDLAERSHKRAKQQPERARSRSAEDEVMINATLPPLAALPAASSPQIPPVEQTTSVPPPMNWNKGVQSGLRTSFASKGLSQSRAPEPQPALLPNLEHNDGDNITPGTLMVVEPQTDAPKSRIEGSYTSKADAVVQPSLPAQPQAEETEDAKPKGKKGRKKKTQASGPNTSGVNVTAQKPPTPKAAPIAPRDRDLPKLHPPGTKCVYKNGNGIFDLKEVLQGTQQVRLQDLTAKLFADHFLATNGGKLNSLTAKHIRGAFSIYINHYYAHMGKGELERARISSIVPVKDFSKCLVEARKAAKENGAKSKADGKAAKAARSAKAEPKLPVSPERTTAGMQIDTENGTASTLELPAADAGDTPSSNGDNSDSPLASSDLEREEGEMSSDALDAALSDLEIEMLQKYFPVVPGSVSRPRCLACAGSSHKTLDCPALTCKTCGKNHLITTCPENARCLKCRARGHLAKECPEKLFRAQPESGGCDLCQSQDHLENACHLIWRTYHPRPAEIKKVRDIPLSCYVCGSGKHYGPECGLHSGRIRSGGVTWSKANLQKYLDPSSSERAICSVRDLSLPNAAKKVFNIRGQAEDPIMLDDSDDDGQFIHPSVKPSAPKNRGRGMSQQIQFAHNQIPAHPRNPPRQTPSHFGDYNGLQDSARYGRERAFSPPPRYDDFRVGFNENDRYLPQAPARGDYRLSDGVRRPGQVESSSFRGGQSGRGRGTSARGGSNARGRKRGKSSK